MGYFAFQTCAFLDGRYPWERLRKPFWIFTDLKHTRESAEIVGLQSLAWLAGHEDLLPVFLGSTGVSEEDLRARAQDPEFLGFVLDFIMMDDAWVIEFCASQQLTNDALMWARAALPGGGEVNWT